MTTADLASAVQEIQAKAAGERLIAEFAHGIDNRDVDRALATCHPRCIFTIAPDRVIDGQDGIRAFVERNLAAFPEMYHWYANISLTVTGETTMHGECRVSALCRAHSGTPVFEVGTEVYEFTKETGDWLISSCALTVHRKDPWGPRPAGPQEEPHAAAGPGAKGDDCLVP